MGSRNRGLEQTFEECAMGCGHRPISVAVQEVVRQRLFKASS